MQVLGNLGGSSWYPQLEHGRRSDIADLTNMIWFRKGILCCRCE